MGEKPREVAMSHACSSPAIAGVPTPQAAEVCAYCGRCTIRTDTWTLRETERVEQIHAQCPLSRIFKRYFRPTIDLLTWLSVVTALLANTIVAARGEAALKKTELAACAGRLVLRQRAVAYAAIGTTMPSCGLDKQCHARVPSVVACCPFLVSNRLTPTSVTNAGP